MPELPDVESARRQIQERALHRRIADVYDGDTYVSRPHAPGEIADALTGAISPGGKLPVTIARNVGQLPIFYNHKPSARRGYIDGSTAPPSPLTSW